MHMQKNVATKATNMNNDMLVFKTHVTCNFTHISFLLCNVFVIMNTIKKEALFIEEKLKTYTFSLSTLRTSSTQEIKV